MIFVFDSVTSRGSLSKQAIRKSSNSSKYIVGGSLIPEEEDSDIFVKIETAYSDWIKAYGLNVSDNLKLNNGSIHFLTDDITLSNILKLLKSNLGFNITYKISNTCDFTPPTCGDFFKLEAQKLFN